MLKVFSAITDSISKYLLSNLLSKHDEHKKHQIQFPFNFCANVKTVRRSFRFSVIVYILFEVKNYEKRRAKTVQQMGNTQHKELLFSY